MFFTTYQSQRKVVFSLCTLAHSQQQNKRFGFVLLGRTTARSGTKHKPASAAMVQEAAQLSSHSPQQQALFLCYC